MNRPQRAIEYSIDEATPNDTSIDVSFGDLKAFMNSAVGRVAQLEVNRFDPAKNIQAPASANGAASIMSAPSEDNDIGEELEAVARNKQFFVPISMNAKSPKSRPTTFSPEKEWEGYIVTVDRDHMIANLIDLTARESRPSSTVEIPFKELETVVDIKRLRPGMIFRWAVGYLRMPGGTKKRYSNIVFRDLPQWTKRELAEAKKQAAEMAKYFAGAGDESEPPSVSGLRRD